MKVFLSIQYLRGLAAIMVVCYHATVPALRMYTPDKPSTWLASGVDIFFVISGFIIITSQMDRTDGAIEFLKRRFFRVIPLYWAMTFAMIVAHLSVNMSANLSLDPMHVISSLALIPHYNPSYPNYIWPLLIGGWTLMYEMLFYGLTAVGVFFVGQRFPVFLIPSIFILTSLGIIYQPTNAVARAYTDPLLLEFIFGTIIALWIRRFSFPKILVILFFVGIALLYVSKQSDSLRAINWGIPAALIVIGAISSERFLPVSKLGFLLGEASFSIYLSQGFSLSFIRGIWKIFDFAREPAYYPIFFTLAVSTSVIVGIVVYYGFERPMLRWSRSRSVKHYASAERRLAGGLTDQS